MASLRLLEIELKDGKQYSLIKGLSAGIEILFVYNDNYTCSSEFYHVGKTHL
jgi:hypothetical protein